MPRPRSAMRKIREVLRLAGDGQLTQRQIAMATGMSRATVQRCVERAPAAGLSWPLPEGLDDRALETKLFGRPAPRDPSRPLPDWVGVHRELRRNDMTLMLLWEEYRQRAGPRGYEYSQFCLLYRQWQRQLDAVMRQEHRAGEKLFVDFAGETLAITDPKTGEVKRCQVFVAVMGASNYTYVEAVPSQELRHWIGAHVRALEFIGGVPQLVIPDCLRAAVSVAHRYDPAVNQTYAEMATHYQTAVLPARPRKPRDKAKVEVGVQIVERWILARLRHRVFFSLTEANQCDGAGYHSSPTARDRDRLRQEHLERLGWRFHRIWSTEWFRYREAEVGRAVAAYRAAVDRPTIGKDVVPETAPPKPPTVMEPVKSRGRGPKPVRPGRGLIKLYSQFELAALIRWIESDTLLRTEDELIDEAISELGFRRRSENMVDALRAAIRVSRKSWERG